MAQHIPIECFTQKTFKTIAKSIYKDFRGYGCKCSMKYEFDKSLSRFHATNKNDEVYFCERFIGAGVVHGTKRGSFEIHFDKDKGEVTNIYLVA